MSIPKKGARKITVDGEKFVWLIRRQASNTQAEYPEGCLHVAVEREEESGSVLLILTDRLHPKGFSLKHSELVAIQPNNGLDEVRIWKIEKKYEIIPVTPSAIALWIKQARQIGWLPKKPGKTFKVCVVDGSLEKI